MVNLFLVSELSGQSFVYAQSDALYLRASHSGGY